MKQALEKRESLNLARTYPVAPQKVWHAWTDPDALRIWWNQSDNPAWQAELDVRVGGSYRIVMRGPDGRDHDVRGVYREVIPYRKLAFTWTVQGSTPELPRLDGESLVTVLLKPLPGGGTELAFRQEPIFDESARGGWNGALDRLGSLLQEI
jgi:uncharacterized protein YndB with AHSA1/START domain